MPFTLKRAAAAGALCALLFAAPAPASARVEVTVEFAYGGVLACGVGFFLYFGQTWEAPLAARALQGALLEFGDGPARLGVPLPSLRPGGERPGDARAHDTLQIDLLRWRF